MNSSKKDKGQRKSSKPNGAEDPDLEAKRTKKRIQNRNSQKCYREKQASQLRALEKLLENTNPGDATGQNSESNVKLLKENQELQDALLRMRKKFLSLSTAASSSAGMFPGRQVKRR